MSTLLGEKEEMMKNNSGRGIGPGLSWGSWARWGRSLGKSGKKEGRVMKRSEERR